jgi:hypothetical protein
MAAVSTRPEFRSDCLSMKAAKKLGLEVERGACRSVPSPLVGEGQGGGDPSGGGLTPRHRRRAEASTVDARGQTPSGSPPIPSPSPQRGGESRRDRGKREIRALLLGALLLGLAWVLGAPAEAQRIENATANFAALDKVTASVKQLPIELNKTESFRTLKITPRVCYTRDPREPPRTSTFVEIDEILIDGKQKRIFSGWMFAESPGLNPLVHPVFDLWLTGCSQPLRAPSVKGPSASPDAAGGPSGDPTAPPPRRRVPR